MMRLFFLMFCALFFVVPAHAMEKACTMIGCMSGFELRLNGPWAPGKYTFDIVADGKKTNCQASLPFADCDGTVQCDGDGVSIGESGCALPPDVHGFHNIMMTEIPAHVALTVTGENGQQFHYETDVNKTCGFPNGKDCDLQPCCSASAQADIVWEGK